ncbi:MAG TPA: hypothetical protein DCW90_18805 [Lachnospiraceae bacterium]|nr:hypothetical protein [Lachnospiraceae bacterium]
MRDDFAVFILSHGRADKIKTLHSLEKGNYTGKTFIVIDNEDETAEEYYKLYGERVIMFDKLEIAKRFDTGDNFNERRTIVYARNACFDIAEKLGLKYFLELDDDYTSFMFRKIKGDKLIGIECRQLDRLFERMIDFLEESNALTVAFAQGGDFIGGANSKTFKKKLLRKAMNTFFCKTENRFDFLGRINEDVNTYTSLGSKGKLLFTVTDACITQVQTQKNGGGMTDVYLDSGTYLKSFYSVMYSPSCVKIGVMGASSLRIHHHVYWNNCTPKIVNERWKK